MRLEWYHLSLGIIVTICSFVAGEPFATELNRKVPEMVVLDSLSNLYEGVSFDHALHDSYASCVECHHHVAGQPSADPACSSCHRSGTVDIVVDCKSCHLTDPFYGDLLSAKRNLSRYHIDMTGLIGAYHLNCLGCHLALTAGPTGCLDCHQRKRNDSLPQGINGTHEETE
ncbi:MAG: cytochrome c family protein [Desulfofustis sp.]|nr:cytochrome c family protein [Desulfofustis sp.]